MRAKLILHNLLVSFVQNTVLIQQLEEKFPAQEVFLVMNINSDSCFVDMHKVEHFVDQPIYIDISLDVFMKKNQ